MERNRIKKICIAYILIISILFSGCAGSIKTLVPKERIGFTNLSEDSIQSDHIMNVIKEITSKKYDGRLVGTEGNRLAEEYIAAYFKKIGLKNPDGLSNYKQTYNQRVVINNSRPLLQIMNNSGKVIRGFRYAIDYICYAFPQITISGETEGKAVVIDDAGELLNKDINLKNKIVLVSWKLSSNDANMQRVLGELLSGNRGIRGIVIENDVNNPENKYKHLVVNPYAPNFTLKNKGPQLFIARSEAFKELAESAKRDLTIHMKIDLQVKNVAASNVIGLIPGINKELQNEFIIISGHMDHVGDNMDGSYNPGALDNASGIGTMMEIARVVKNNKISPERSILFIAFNGEEEGLLGASYYAKNPVYPLKKSVVINLDMIGSKNELPLLLVNATEKETKLRKDLYKCAEKLQIKCNEYMETSSDHTPFAERGVEALTLINLDTQTSGYHSPMDTMETSVDEGRIEEITRLVLYYLDKKAY